MISFYFVFTGTSLEEAEIDNPWCVGQLSLSREPAFLDAPIKVFMTVTLP